MKRCIKRIKGGLFLDNKSIIYESSVCENYDKKVKIIIILRILIVIFLLITATRFYFLFGNNLSDFLLRLIIFLLSLGITAVLIFICSNVIITYDYSLGNDQLVVAKVFNERRRKVILNIKLKGNVKEICSFNENDYKIDKRISFYSANKTAVEGKSLIVVKTKDSGNFVVEVTNDFEEVISNLL